jgi:hypothetical protein
MSACGERKGGRCAHLAFGRRRSKRDSSATLKSSCDLGSPWEFLSARGTFPSRSPAELSAERRKRG